MSMRTLQKLNDSVYYKKLHRFQSILQPYKLDFEFHHPIKHAKVPYLGKINVEKVSGLEVFLIE